MMDCYTLKMLEYYNYFKLKKKEVTKSGYSIYELLRIHQNLKECCDTGILNFDELYEDPILHRSVDAFIKNAFSHVNQSSEKNTNINDMILKNTKQLLPKQPKNINESKKNKFPRGGNKCLSTLEKNMSKKVTPNISMNSQNKKNNKIQAPLPKIIKSRSDVYKNEKFPKVLPERDSLKSNSKIQDEKLLKDGQVIENDSDKLHFTINLKSNNSIPVQKTDKKSKSLCGDRKYFKTANMSESHSGVMLENKASVIYERTGIKISSTPDSNNSCSKLSAVKRNYHQTNNKVQKPDMQHCTKKFDGSLCEIKQNIPCEQLQTKIPKHGFQSGANDLAVTNLLHPTTENNVGISFMPINSTVFEPVFPSDKHHIQDNLPNYVTADNSCDTVGQFDQQDHFNWNTCNLYPSYQGFSGESSHFPYDENVPFWSHQWTPTWDNFHHYPTPQDLNTGFDRNDYVNQHYETYFGPAQAIFHSRLQLSDGTRLPATSRPLD